MKEKSEQGKPKISNTGAKNKTQIKRQNESKKYYLAVNPQIPTATDDYKPCQVRGVDVTSPGTLIIADEANKAVNVYSPKHELLSSVLLAEKPYSVAILNDTTVTISSWGYIFILDISDPFVPTVRRSVDIGCWASSMTMCNYSLVMIKFSEMQLVKEDEAKDPVWKLVDFKSVKMMYKCIEC